METGLSGSQYRDIKPPPVASDDSDDSKEPEEVNNGEEEPEGDECDDAYNYTRVKGTTAQILRDEPGVNSAALDTHGEFHFHEVDQLSRQTTETIRKIDKTLADENIRDIFMCVATTPDVLESVAEALS